MKVEAIAVTGGIGKLQGKTPQEIITYTARVSNPDNQMNFETAPKLLAYCIKNKHLSIFEQASMTLEIKTSRAIAAQLLRHRSFQFQEFSFRYSLAKECEIYSARRQDTKNRQNSIDDLTLEIKDWFISAQEEISELAFKLYSKAIEYNIAKECARFFLPLSTSTTLYMTGSVRSWITYLQIRLDKSTQLEHREIAEEISKIFAEIFPDIWTALKLLENKNEC